MLIFSYDILVILIPRHTLVAVMGSPMLMDHYKTVTKIYFSK